MRIWTWRNSDRWDRYRCYLWELPGHQLMAGEQARIAVREAKLSGKSCTVSPAGPGGAGVSPAGEQPLRLPRGAR
ncbi:hypothetical protein, partial [Sphaerisporangium aureirubrum]